MRRALGTALALIIAVQVFTGLLLMTVYSPAVDAAWASVFFAQYKMTAGWFVRGLHHYGAQAVMVVLGMHLLEGAARQAYRAPHHRSWWLGLASMGVIQGMALTGYLLPWDQRGYWATTVATNIMGSVPLVGESLKTFMVGGSEYGQLTLSRLFSLHVGWLPYALIALGFVHYFASRKADATPSTVGEHFRAALFACAGLAVIVALTLRSHGAPLEAPADPGSEYSPRPEWYFLFLFQLLKYLPGDLEVLGSAVLPGLAVGYLAALPILSKRIESRAVLFAPLVLGGVGIVALTTLAFRSDANDQGYQEARLVAEKRAHRAVSLASRGVPPDGPLAMMLRDPLSRGEDVFNMQCTGCHVLNGLGERQAPDHTGFGSRAWTRAMIEDPRAPHFFGKTTIDDMESQSELGEQKLTDVTEFLFAEGVERQDPGHVDAASRARGEAVFRQECMDCHQYRGEGNDLGIDAPNLTGYASRTWIARQITHPDAETQYGVINEMPSFADELTANDLAVVTGFLRQQRFATPSFPSDQALEASAAVRAKR